LAIHAKTVKCLQAWVTHKARLPSTKFTRQCTGTLSTHHFATPRCFTDWVSVLHTQDRQCAPCIFVDNLRKDSQVFARLHTKQDISHFFLLLRNSFDSPFRLITTFCGLSFSFVVYVLDLLASNGVFCLQSVGFGVSWTFTVIFLNDSRGSTLFVSQYTSFA
jgi:hypothetical protein